jgi:hypothetical protein
MVLEIPSELPDLDLSELSGLSGLSEDLDLPDLSNLPDLDSDLELDSISSKNISNKSSDDFELDQLLNFNSEFNSEFEKEFGLEDKSTNKSTDINDLLDQLQTSSDFSDLSLDGLDGLDGLGDLNQSQGLEQLGELDAIVGLEDLSILDSLDPEIFGQAESTSQTIGELGNEHEAVDFGDLLEDFSTAETIVHIANQSEKIEEFSQESSFVEQSIGGGLPELTEELELSSNVDFILPDFDESFLNPTISEPVEDFNDPLRDLLSDPLSNSLETSIDSSILMDQFPIESLEDLTLEGLDSSLEISSFEAESLGFESLEIGNLESENLDPILPELSDSIPDLASIEPIKSPVEQKLEDQFDPLNQSFAEPLAELEFPQEPLNEFTSDFTSELLPELKDNSILGEEFLGTGLSEPGDYQEVFGANSLPDFKFPEPIGSIADPASDLIESQPDMVGLDDQFGDQLGLSPELSAELIDLESLEPTPVEDLAIAETAKTIIPVMEEIDKVEEEVEGEKAEDEFDPFSESFSPSFDQTFEQSPIQGFTAILTTESSAKFEDVPEQVSEMGSDQFPENLTGSLGLEEVAIAQAVEPVIEAMPELVVDDYTQPEFNQPELHEDEFNHSELHGQDISDFTQILTSAQADTGILVNENSPIVANEINSFGVVQEEIQEETRIEDFTNNRFNQSSSTSFQPEIIPTPALDLHNNDLDSSNGMIENQEADLNSMEESDTNPNPLVKFGLPILLIGALVGGIAFIRTSQNPNNPPTSQPSQNR